MSTEGFKSGGASGIERPNARVVPGSLLQDAISVLERIDLTVLSQRPETENAGNRVAVALGYLREAVKAGPQAQIEPEGYREHLKPITDLLRGAR